MKTLKWGFAIFVLILGAMFFMGHLETDGKSTGLVFNDPVPQKTTVMMPDGVKTSLEVPRKNRPVFPRLHKLFHPRQQKD